MYSGRAREQALQHLASGATFSEVSRATGISRSTLCTWRSSGEAGPVGECPHCDDTDMDGPAYSALLGFYLGDGCLSAQARYWALRISCDAALPGIVEDTRRAIRGVRPGCRVFLVPAPGTVVVQAHWTH